MVGLLIGLIILLVAITGLGILSSAITEWLTRPQNRYEHLERRMHKERNTMNNEFIDATIAIVNEATRHSTRN